VGLTTGILFVKVAPGKGIIGPFAAINERKIGVNRKGKPNLLVNRCI